jgi:hypothetical protein
MSTHCILSNTNLVREVQQPEITIELGLRRSGVPTPLPVLLIAYKFISFNKNYHSFLLDENGPLPMAVVK